MDLETAILLVAFRYRIEASDSALGFQRFQEILRQEIDESDFCLALGQAIAMGHVFDPVRLPTGALQCHWCLEVTPSGADAVRALIQAKRIDPRDLFGFHKAVTHGLGLE
jgi:hypothetical protein